MSLVSLVSGLAVSGLGVRNMLEEPRPAVAGGVETADAQVAASPIDSPEPSITSEPSATPAASEQPLEPASLGCSNAALGYSLEFPALWTTVGDGPRLQCRFFDEGSFTVGSPPIVTEAAIAVVPQNIDYDSWVNSFENEGIEVIQRFETTVGGMPATVTEYRFVGDEGGPIYEYDISYEGVLIIYADSAYSDDFGYTKSVVDSMAESLTFI